MNVFSLGCVGHAVMFKVIIGGGMAMPDYFLFRNAFLWLCSMVELYLTNAHACKDFPEDRAWTLISKCVLSQASFTFVNWSLIKIPLFI